MLTLPALLLAAVLEAGGDALVRSGLQTPAPAARLAYWVAGGTALFSYGCLVNMPAWDFGRSLGVYVVLFFVVAQIISWVAFGQPPSRTMLIGGVLIAVGGFVIAAGSGPGGANR